MSTPTQGRIPPYSEDLIETSNITIIDSPPGSGKTTWATNLINSNPNTSYVYCTPFLDEIKELQKDTKIIAPDGREIKRFWQPYRDEETTKLDNFNELLADSRDIAVTHATFLNSTEETLDILYDNEYTLILDEALDVVKDFNTVSEAADERQKMTKGDIQIAIDSNIISIDEDMKVHWIARDYTDIDNKFYAIYKYAKLGRLYCVDQKFLLTAYPPEIFSSFKEIYVMTYMFESSIMKYYFDKFGIEYELASVAGSREEGYQLTEYSKTQDLNYRKRCKELIHICKNRRLNDFKDGALSKTWYKDKSAKHPEITRLRRNLKHYFTKELINARASNGDLMWTCYDDYKNYIAGNGYTKQRKLTKEEKKLPTDEREELEKKLLCYVPCNSKGTDRYRERWALAYCINLNINPELVKFFSPITVYKNKFSLSALIQWIGRSRIRDDKPIELYLPSPRMRELLNKWFENQL